MPASVRRLAAVALAATVLSSTSRVLVAQPEPAPAMTEDQRLLPYIQSGQLVDIGGRRINMQCAGSGQPTVILMAGIFSWSMVWYKTQAVMAQRARVCAFDRAAYGFSDPPPRPQILSDVVDDLHAVLNSGSIPGPYVLVGHSLGGLEARVYAQRWPEEVVGLVLVDTAVAAEGLIDANQQPALDKVEGRETYTADMLHCASVAARGPFDPSSQDFKDCAATLPGDTPAAFSKVWPNFFTSQYFADKISLMSSVYTHRYDSADHHRVGAMPLVVLSADTPSDADTTAAPRLSRSYQKTWIAMHERLAHLSACGIHRVIKGSKHHIQLDQPQAVIDALDTVLRQLHSDAQERQKP